MIGSQDICAVTNRPSKKHAKATCMCICSIDSWTAHNIMWKLKCTVMYDATSQIFSFFGTKVENCLVCIPLASISYLWLSGASTVSTCTFAKPGIATPHSLHPTIGICAQSVHLWTYLVSFWLKIALKFITHTPTTKLRQTKSLTWQFLQILHPCIHPPALLTFSNLD